MDLTISKKSLYFNDEEFTLIKGDSFCVLRKITPKSVDMIFADPPYFYQAVVLAAVVESKCQLIKVIGISH